MLRLSRPMFWLSRAKLGMFRMCSTYVSTVLDLCFDCARPMFRLSQPKLGLFRLCSIYVSTFSTYVSTFWTSVLTFSTKIDYASTFSTYVLTFSTYVLTFSTKIGMFWLCAPLKINCFSTVKNQSQKCTYSTINFKTKVERFDPGW